MTRKHLYFLLAGFIAGALCGFFVGKGMYDQPLQESVTRDTTTTIDTIPDIAPEPKDSTPVRTIIRWLPMKLPKKSGTNESVDNPYPASTDTVTQWQYFGIAEQLPEHPQDSALVEIPITSKHYSTKEYDAWVSGYEPSLDSIFVYQEKQIITETITRTVKENKHFFLDVNGGCAYQVNRSRYMPFAELRLTFKKGKWGIGASGGYVHDSSTNTASPYGKAVLSYDIVSF